MYNTLIENPRKPDFRVWDAEKHQWLDELIGINKHGVVIDNRNNVDDLSLHDSAIISWSTGLLDKEKNKIFEGDIVRFGKNNPFPIDRSARILEGIVEWEPAGAMFVVVVYDGKEPDVVTEIHELRQADKIYTVVGNVFEGIKI